TTVDNTVTCTLGNLASGASATVTIVLTPTAVGTLTNTATVTSSADDPVADNNTVRQDTTVGAALSPNERYVWQVYFDLLQRTVDPGGLAYWAGQLDDGLPREQMATALVHSDEYLATIVRPAYVQFLGRDAEATGLAFWIG